MPRDANSFLDVNDPFPKMELKLISGESLSLPEGTGEGYSVILFYRGFW